MMNMEFIKKQILSMDVKSDSFFDLYTSIADKYYEVEDPDEVQKARQTLRLIADKGDDEQVFVCLQVATELFKMDSQNSGAISASMGFGDKEYHFTISTDPTALGNLQKALKNNIVVESQNSDNDDLNKRGENER